MMAILRDLKYGTKGFQLVMMGCFLTSLGPAVSKNRCLRDRFVKDVVIIAYGMTVTIIESSYCYNQPIYLPQIQVNSIQT